MFTEYVIETSKQRRYTSLRTAQTIAKRVAKVTEKPIYINRWQLEDYGSSLSAFQEVSPDGTIRRWEKNEWLLPNQRKDADGRIVIITEGVSVVAA